MLSSPSALLRPAAPGRRLLSCATKISPETRIPFSTSPARREILDASTLPNRIVPRYEPSRTSSLLSLTWPRPPRNILLIPKLHAPNVTQSALDFARHLHAEYPGLNLMLESRVASDVHEALHFPIYAAADPAALLPAKTDLVVTMGGDGTILRAASLFSMHASVPPVLSFSMGTLGFLGEWKFAEFRRAWHEVYTSGGGGGGTAATVGEGARDTVPPETPRTSRILLRHRLKVGVYDEAGTNINSQLTPTSTAEAHQHPDTVPVPLVPPPPPPPSVLGADGATPPAIHAINELLIHRGPHPHLAIIDIYINGHFLTEAVADGILVSTPTGSTAYSLSAGGSIIHPLVKSLLITPICPRSLSFRPLVLPLGTRVVLRLSERNRGRELEVSIDGKRRAGVGIGMQIRVEGETIGRAAGDGGWLGGVPCVIRGSEPGASEDDDGWVGGLNGLLKFNYPFGQAP